MDREREHRAKRNREGCRNGEVTRGGGRRIERRVRNGERKKRERKIGRGD